MTIRSSSEKYLAGAQSPQPQSGYVDSSPTKQIPTLQAQNSSTILISQHSIPGEYRNGRESSSSTFERHLSSASTKSEVSSPPVGFCDATASIAATPPSLTDIHRGGSDGLSEEGQLKVRKQSSSVPGRNLETEEADLQISHTNTASSPPKVHISTRLYPNTVAQIEEENQQNQSMMNPGPGGPSAEDGKLKNRHSLTNTSTDTGSTPAGHVGTGTSIYRTTPFNNGYQFPPQHTWTEATLIGTKAFWKFATTPLGFLITIYGLNVVAWGGMIFLLLCNAAPAMCHPTCNDINSPRRIWIEIDSQVLTALFCVTGFGLIPWRFRDLYYLLRWRLMKDPMGLRRLAGIHRDWFRLEGSENLPVTLGPADIESEHASHPEMSLPYPLTSIPDAPLTGIRAPPTPTWRLDYVVWNFVWNTFLQAILSGLMWGLNRYNRPSWSTGLFVALACIVAALAGIEIFVQGKKVKAVEGVEVSERDLERLRRDKEMGRVNINTMSGKVPKQNAEGKGGWFVKKTKKSKEEVPGTDEVNVIR